MPLPLPFQRGAALATALFFLVIITLLGLAAMRAGRMDLRLALNEESRVNALETAQSLLEALLANDTSLAVGGGSGYVQSCYVAPALDAAALRTRQSFDCPSGTPASPLPTAGTLATQAYTRVRRENINGADFAPVASVRASSLYTGDSGERYRLANFTVTAGVDRTPASRAAGVEEVGGYGAAEISQGTLVKVPVVEGLVMQ